MLALGSDCSDRNPWLCYLVVNYAIILSLNLPICKMGIIAVPSSPSCWESKEVKHSDLSDLTGVVPDGFKGPLPSAILQVWILAPALGNKMQGPWP